MLALFVSVVAGMILHAAHLQKNVVKTAALHHARLYVDALTQFRTLYSSEVVSVAYQHGLEVTHDYKQRPGAIPLPATLSMLLGARIGEGASGEHSRLYSPYPFPWRSTEGGLRGESDRQVWQQLSANPDEPVTRFETRDGHQFFRFAVADRMRESCVGCHNGHPDSPKRDWQVGDLRGVLEVVMPLDGIIAETKSDLKQTINFYVGISLLLLLVMASIVVRQWRYSYTLEKHVADRTAALTYEIELRKGVEENLILAKEKAECASKAKTDFLSHMSHELRTPLNAVIGFSQLLMEDDLGDSQKRDIGIILSSGRHLLELINQLLDLSRIESGRLDLNMEAVPLSPLLRECRVLLEPMAQQRGIGLAGLFSCHEQAVAWVDRLRLKQVLLNLVSNAIKYNRENGSVEIRCQETPGHHLRISVIDTGPGLDEPSQQLLFQPFERLGAANSRVEGTGIGLFVCKQLVEAMGGTIGVQSRIDEGSEFWVELKRPGH
jgi:signal transduction histidine kinase